MQPVNLTNHFLIAMPNMADPYFSKSLTYICEHNEQGALGVVVNRPIDMTLQALFEQISIPLGEPRLRGLAVHFGGPVQIDRGFVLHKPLGDWQSTLAVNQELGLTTSKDILLAVGRGNGPQHILVTLGYAGWAPGQLESELALNGWLTVPFSRNLLFGTALSDRYDIALAQLGITRASLSGAAGHA